MAKGSHEGSDLFIHLRDIKLEFYFNVYEVRETSTHLNSRKLGDVLRWTPPHIHNTIKLFFKVWLYLMLMKRTHDVGESIAWERR